MPMIENGLLGPTPTHPLMQSAGTRAPWGPDDTVFGKPKIVRQRRVS
jgi:hypothetical protein